MRARASRVLYPSYPEDLCLQPNRYLAKWLYSASVRITMGALSSEEAISQSFPHRLTSSSWQAGASGSISRAVQSRLSLSWILLALLLLINLLAFSNADRSALPASTP